MNLVGTYEMKCNYICMYQMTSLNVLSRLKGFYKYVMELILQNSCVYDMYIPYAKNILSLTYFCTCSHRIMYSYSWWKKLAKSFKICHFTYKERKTTCMYVLLHSKNMINFEAFRHLIKHKPLISEVCSSINLKKSYLVLSWYHSNT